MKHFFTWFLPIFTYIYMIAAVLAIFNIVGFADSPQDPYCYGLAALHFLLSCCYLPVFLLGIIFVRSAASLIWTLIPLFLFFAAGNGICLMYNFTSWANMQPFPAEDVSSPLTKDAFSGTF